MIVSTTRFGDIEVEDGEIIRFKKGILGFDEVTRFVFIPHEKGSPFCFLQAVDDPDLVFVATNPLWLRPDYQVEAYPEDIADLMIESDDDVTALVLVTVPKDPREMTVNLLAPILINVKNGFAKQVVQRESRYSVRHRVADELKRLKELSADDSQTDDAQAGNHEAAAAAESNSTDSAQSDSDSVKEGAKGDSAGGRTGAASAAAGTNIASMPPQPLVRVG